MHLGRRLQATEHPVAFLELEEDGAQALQIGGGEETRNPGFARSPDRDGLSGLEGLAAGAVLRGGSFFPPEGPDPDTPGAMNRKPVKGLTGTPPLPRLKLDSLQRVRLEMAQIYVEAKHGRRDVQDASRLANILALIGRLLEGGELESRLNQLERLLAEQPK